MRRTILNVAYPFAPVREDTCGGAEQVLLMLDAAITAAGHTSVVAACKGSECRGSVLTTEPAPDRIDDRSRIVVWERYRQTIAEAIRNWRPDLIHLHGIDFFHYLPEPGIPVLVTLHLPVAWYQADELRPHRSTMWFNCVSKSQHEECNAQMLLPYVENGIDVHYFLQGSCHERKNFALCLGRICPEKGFHVALSAARQAGIGCRIAGEVFPYPAHEDYFVNSLFPKLDGRQFRFIGPVGMGKKRDLLCEARCLLVPSLVPETSSLVAMEALACGTPVIAFPAGELASIIEHGKTGFLVENEKEMVHALTIVDRIDPADCRASAVARFDAKIMTGHYLRLYEQLIGFAETGTALESMLNPDLIFHEN